MVIASLDKKCSANIFQSAVIPWSVSFCRNIYLLKNCSIFIWIECQQVFAQNKISSEVNLFKLICDNLVSVEYFSNTEFSLFVSSRLLSSESTSINICPQIFFLDLEKSINDIRSAKTVNMLIETTTDPEVSTFY